MEIVKGAMRPFLLCCCLVLSLPALAVGKNSADVEIDGLLLDNTISRQGREFSFFFSQYWREVPDTQGMNVQLVEEVVPRAGTRLMVKLNRQPVYATYLGRRHSPVKEQAEQAILVLMQALASNRFGQGSQDLAEDEW